MDGHAALEHGLSDAHLNGRFGRLAPGVLVALLATAMIATVIAVGTLTPATGPVLPSDKLDHALAFAALTVPTAIARPRWAIWLFIGACGYGAAIEFVQPSVGRTGDIGDFWADAAGAAGGCAIGAAVAWAVRSLRG